MRHASAILVLVLSVTLAACATREIPYPELRAKYGLASSRTFEPSPGLVVHYSEEGNANGRTLVFVHGFAASVHAWRPWIERLKGDYRLIAIDLPGHGLTQAPKGYRASLDANVELVRQLAEELDEESFVLVGNSMGGAVALGFARAYPERLDGLVLVNSAGWPGEEGDRPSGPPWFVGLFNNPVGQTIIKWFDPRGFALALARAAYVDEALVTKDLIDRYGDFAMGIGHRDILLTQTSQPSRPFRLADFVAMDTPTLVMTGEQDEVIPTEQSRAIAAAIPGARLVSYPRGGHVPMEQLPDESAKDLREFLGSLPTTRE